MRYLITWLQTFQIFSQSEYNFLVRYFFMPGYTCIITEYSVTITISQYSRNTDPILNLLINTYRTFFWTRFFLCSRLHNPVSDCIEITFITLKFNIVVCVLRLLMFLKITFIIKNFSTDITGCWKFFEIHFL